MGRSEIWRIVTKQLRLGILGEKPRTNEILQRSYRINRYNSQGWQTDQMTNQKKEEKENIIFAKRTPNQKIRAQFLINLWRPKIKLQQPSETLEKSKI